MAEVDRTLLRENLKLTVEQRVQKLSRALRMIEQLRRTGRHTCFLKTMKTTKDVFRYAAEQRNSVRRVRREIQMR